MSFSLDFVPQTFWRNVLLTVILLAPGIAVAEETPLTIGIKAIHTEWVCLDKEAAEAVMVTDVDEGFEAATYGINLLAAFGLCARAEVELRPRRVVKTAKVPRGTLSIVEVNIGGNTLFVITTTRVVDGVAI